MIIFAFGGALPYTKDLPVVKKNQVQKRNCDAALGLAREFFDDKKLKKKDLGPQDLLILKALQNTTM